MKTRLFSVVSMLLVVCLAVRPAMAYDFSGVTGHVINVSPVGFPGNVEFITDNMPTQCNGFLFYFPSGADEATTQENAKAVLATVLAAHLSGKSVSVYGIFPTATFQYCQVQWVYINAS